MDPQPAALIIDGERIGSGQAQYDVFVEPGPHTLRAQLPGYEDGLAEVGAVKGGKAWVSLNLERRGSAAPIAQASTDVRRPPAPAPVVPLTNSAATYRKIGLVTASGGVLLGVGLAVSGVVLDDQVEDRSSALARHGGNFSVCLDAAFKNECAELHALVRARGISEEFLNPIRANFAGTYTVYLKFEVPTEFEDAAHEYLRRVDECLGVHRDNGG